LTDRQSSPTVKVPAIGSIAKEEVVRKIRFDYVFAHKELSNRILDTLQKLVSEGLKPGKDLTQLLNETARMIDKHLQIRTTAIGIKDPMDGRYRYVAMSGLDDAQWQAHKVLSYALQDFFDPLRYRSSKISDLSRLFLVEDSPYNPDEMTTYNSRLSSATIRRSADDCNEGDYFDIDIKGPGGELLGWIEISGTKYGKMPDANVLRWIEMIAMVLGLVLAVPGHARGNGKH
jgi:hypothetical protein